MLNNDKIQEFLLKLAPCIERGDLDACVEEAARLAHNVGMDEPDLLNLSTKMGESGKYDIMFILTLAAAQGLEGIEKALAYSNAGIAAHDIGKLKESEDYYLKAIELNPKSTEAHNNYAILLRKLGRKTEAEKYYKKSIELNPKSSEPYFNYALLLEELGRKTEAEENLKKAIESNPTDASAHNNYAILLEEQGRRNEAEEQFKKALEIDPKNINGHNNYANLLRKNARFYEAEKEVRTTLRIAPTDPYALGTLGDILADEDYLEDAIKKYHDAIKNSDSMECPEKAEIHNNLGWVYVNLEQYIRAKKEFEEAYKLDPQNVKVIRNIRALGKVKGEPKISEMQWCIAIALFIGVIATWYLFLTIKLTENIFFAQTVILAAMIIFILFYHQLGKFKAGPIEFEKSTEHRSQLSEAIAKIER